MHDELKQAALPAAKITPSYPMSTMVCHRITKLTNGLTNFLGILSIRLRSHHRSHLSRPLIPSDFDSGRTEQFTF